jgi:hypothetical protein
MPRRLLLGGAVCAAVLAAALGAGEALVRHVAPQATPGAWFEDGPRGLTLNLAATITAHDGGGRGATYRINRFHQRGRRPGNNAVRVLVLGGTNTFGLLTAEHETFIGLVERRANRTYSGRRFQMLNAATAGWTMADGLAYLELTAPMLLPRAVLLVVEPGDPAASLRRGLYREAGKGGMALAAADAPLRGAGLVRAFRALPGYRWLAARSHLLRLLRDAVTGAAGIGSPPNVADPPTARALLHRLAVWSRANGTPVHLIALGADSVALAADARAEGLEFLDLSAQRRYPGGVYDAAAHARIAAAAWPFLAPRLDSLRYRPRPSAVAPAQRR